MDYKAIKKDDLIMDFTSLPEEQFNHLASYNRLRRKLYSELESINGVKDIFKKYNVFFVDGYDGLNRINIDWD